MDMDVEGENVAATPRGKAVLDSIWGVGSMESQAVRNSTSGKSKTFITESLGICRPPIYDGRRDHNAIERFLGCLDRYLGLFPDTEDDKVSLVACFLSGDAQT